MVVQEERSGDHQSQEGSSSEDHKCLYKISKQHVQPLFIKILQPGPSGGQTDRQIDQQTENAIPRAMLLNWYHSWNLWLCILFKTRNVLTVVTTPTVQLIYYIPYPKHFNNYGLWKTT